MGGAAPILAKGRELVEAGQYLLATEILGKLLHAEPGNVEARRLLADAFEPVGYQQESPSVRNSFLAAVFESRLGIPAGASPKSGGPDVIRARSPPERSTKGCAATCGGLAGLTEIRPHRTVRIVPTPTARRQAAKREQIFAAARKLFLAQGFAATSMDAVTAEAGVSKQTLYSYFPTKQQLLEEIVSTELGRLDLGEPQLDRVTTFEALRTSMLEFAVMLTERLMHLDAVALLRLVLGEAFLVPELREVVRQALPMQILGRTELVLRHAAELRLIRAPRPELSARMFAGPVMTFVIIDGIIRSDAVQPPTRETLAFIVDTLLATVAVDG